MAEGSREYRKTAGEMSPIECLKSFAGSLGQYHAEEIARIQEKRNYNLADVREHQKRVEDYNKLFQLACHEPELALRVYERFRLGYNLFHDALNDINGEEDEKLGHLSVNSAVREIVHPGPQIRFKNGGNSGRSVEKGRKGRAHPGKRLAF